ncbi:hypothetical protein CHARACLAT_028155, partial [Characodon lateralis]|nr:hypothetical protein [Characodon lateralis]
MNELRCVSLSLIVNALCRADDIHGAQPRTFTHRYSPPQRGAALPSQFSLSASVFLRTLAGWTLSDRPQTSAHLRCAHLGFHWHTEGTPVELQAAVMRGGRRSGPLSVLVCFIALWQTRSRADSNSTQNSKDIATFTRILDSLLDGYDNRLRPGLG